MISIDDNMLAQVGLGSLPDRDKEAARAKIGGVFEDRYGDRLMDGLSDTQLDEFENYVINVDPSGGLKWLEQNVPNYQDIFAEELASTLDAVKQGGLAALDKSAAET
jgi:hypothetical protein